MYRRPGAHKAKAAPARWLARYARGGTGESVRGAGVVEAREREAASASGDGRGHDETRDMYSHLLVRASTRACLFACLLVSSQDTVRVPQRAQGLYRLTTDQHFRLPKPVARKFPREDRREPSMKYFAKTPKRLSLPLILKTRMVYISNFPLYLRAILHDESRT